MWKRFSAFVISPPDQPRARARTIMAGKSRIDVLSGVTLQPYFLNSVTVVSLRRPDTIDDPLTAILRSGARRLLAQAIEAEADAFLALMKGERLPDGRSRRRFRLRGRWNACGGASALSGTAMRRSARFRPGLTPWRCSVQSCATVLLASIPFS